MGSTQCYERAYRKELLAVVVTETTTVLVISSVEVKYGVDVVMVVRGGEVVTVVSSKKVSRDVKVVV